MFDDDFSFLTGKQADLDNDGKVSFGEYMNDCDDFNSIYRNKIHSIIVRSSAENSSVTSFSPTF